MAMLDPEIRELSPQPAVTEVSVTDDAGVPGVVDAGFPRLFGRLAELGVEPAGPPFIRYLRTGEELELELGIPVGPDAGQSSGLPGGRAAVLRHVGPFSGLRDACERLERWVAEQGERPAGPFWEAYVTDPRSEPDSSKWITDIVQPVR
jgi:effector-binding domain-containing protein